MRHGLRFIQYLRQSDWASNYQLALKDLYQVYLDFPVPFYSGEFDASFKLRVNRPGCEYNGPVDTGSDAIEELLPEWLKHAAVSGFGDVKTQETKFDNEVRQASEILPEEFSVDQELIERIQEEWSIRFLPRKVKAVPYKIHIYGPGGHFKSHRDTPEKDLVGTFLVGLGDSGWSWGPSGYFCIQDEKFGAKACSWVAFHPDVAHSVSKLSKNQHRAVIAFKIFRDNSVASDALPEELKDRTIAVLEKLQPPYGIFLDRQYCIGTSKMSGFDLILTASGMSRPNTRARVIPVVTTFEASMDVDDYSNECTFSTRVYPFSKAHIDLLVGEDGERADDEVIQWLQGVKDVPFYFVSLKDTTVPWQQDSDEGAEHTGNESRPASEDSIYLSYAMIVLPISANDGDKESELDEESVPSDDD